MYDPDQDPIYKSLMGRKILSLTSVGEIDECWSWNGTFFANGYPQILQRVATRWLMELEIGRPLGKQFQTHHTCGNKWCCNPFCLEILTRYEHRHKHYIPGSSFTPEQSEENSRRMASNWADPAWRAK